MGELNTPQIQILTEKIYCDPNTWWNGRKKNEKMTCTNQFD